MINKWIHFLKFYFLPILSGCLLGTSYIPFPPWALFFCLAPLWHFSLNYPYNFKKLFLAGWLCQFFINLIGFYWIAYTLHVFGNMPWLVSLFGLILFSCIAHLHIPLSLIVWSVLIRFKIFKNEWAKWLLLPVTMALAFSFLPMLFRWNLGYAWFWAKFPAFQTAELWGFQFLGTITLFLQLCFLSLRKKGLCKILLPIGVGIFLALNFLGVFLHTRLDKPTKQVKILMVQHNVSNTRDFFEPRRVALRKISRRLIYLTGKALEQNKNIDFILWSEGAYPYSLFEKHPDRNTKFLQDIVKKTFQTSLVTGGMSENFKGVTNSIFFLNKDGQFKPKRYDKNHLLAFGEFIPGERWFPRLRKYFLGGGKFFIPGKKGPAVRKVESVNLGLQICYESLFESFSRDLAQKSADIIVNVTNDSWFGPGSEPYQHLYMSLARGIENRRPVVRLTNTGFSTAMTAEGKLIGKPSQRNKIWTQVLSVPYSSQAPTTLFMRWGYYINSFFLLFIFILLIFTKKFIFDNFKKF